MYPWTVRLYTSVKGARWKEQTAQHWSIKKEQSSVPGDLGSSLIPVLIKSHDLKSITWPGSNFFRKSRQCTTWPLRSLSESYDILGERFAIRKAQWFYISYLNTPFSWGKNGPGSWRVRKPSVPSCFTIISHTLYLTYLYFAVFFFPYYSEYKPHKGRDFCFIHCCVARI